MTKIYGKKKRKDIIRSRRKQVLNLYWVENYTIHEIANKIEWSPETIFRDIEYIREKAKEQSDVNVNELWLNIHETRKQTLRQLRKELEALEDNPKTAYTRVVISEKIMNITRDNIKDLQELGFISKPKDSLEITEPENYKFKVIRHKEKEK